jgi:aminoglycoside phosphotransferase family enzyme
MRRSITSPIGKAFQTRSSTSWRSLSAVRTLAPRSAARAAHALETYIEQNRAAFAERNDLFDPPTARKLTVDSRRPFAVVRPALLERGEAGFVRRCHGDLHLLNIVLIDGEPTFFDAVELPDEVASGDVLYDLAFLLMDLEERGLRAPPPTAALAGGSSVQRY